MSLKINLIPNGPIQVKAEDQPFPILRCEMGEDLQPEGQAFLCRCGESENKPFCDGAHAKAEYSDENRCENDELRDFSSPEITVHFNRSICSGAGHCVKSLPGVFVSGAEDWIRPAEGKTDEIIATIEKCPSGALTYTRNGETVIQKDDEMAIKIVKDGPYVISGLAEFTPDQWSQNASNTRFALCRCGKSSNAPFCDYSHGEQGWKDGQ